jgi:predicted RNase H-like nuclease (RuvC/YqgF family)
MQPMPQSVQLEISGIEQRLRQVEEEFDSEMRARGFDPSQAENSALTSSLSRLYQEREDLRTKLAALRSGDEQEA